MRSNARLRNALCSISLLLLLPQMANAATHIVTVSDNSFSPSAVFIEVGDTVEWRNAAGGNQHNVTANDGSFSSQTAASFTFSRTFDEEDTIFYHCSVHPGVHTGTVRVEPPSTEADLEMQFVNAENGTYSPGSAIPIDILIQNIGNSTSPNFTVTYYASTNSSINGADTPLGTDSRQALTAGGISAYAANARFPNNMEGGDYFIGAIINVNDANNGNNDGVYPIRVTVSGSEPVFKAELDLLDVMAPTGTFEQGTEITIGTEIKNSGNLASGPFSVSYYASTNTSITSTDRLMGTEDRTSVEIGETVVQAFDAIIPENLTPGTYYVGAIINFDDNVASNNNDYAPNTIMVTEPEQPFQIDSGLNGTWWGDLTRNGEGAQLEVTDAGDGSLAMFGNFYSYDPLGNQIYLVMVGPISGDSATLDVYITTGGLWGSNFNPAFVDESQWGTATLVGINCEEIHIELAPNEDYVALDYDILSYNLIRLNVPSAPCPAQN